MAKKTLEDARIHNGKHTQACDCSSCTKVRLEAYKAKVSQMSEVRLPSDPSACVPVRGHFRKMKRFGTKHPRFQSEVADLVKRIMNGKSNLF